MSDSIESLLNEERHSLGGTSGQKPLTGLNLGIQSVTLNPRTHNGSLEGNLMSLTTALIDTHLVAEKINRPLFSKVSLATLEP